MHIPVANGPCFWHTGLLLGQPRHGEWAFRMPACGTTWQEGSALFRPCSWE